MLACAHMMTSTPPPLFSIITASYNAAPVLPRLLESLASQTFRDFELIVQDGASGDDTVAVLERFRGRLPALSLESAPDTGIYDAWNKAVPRVSGEWVLFLGADDRLAGTDTLERLAGFIRENDVSGVDFLAGDVPVVGDNGTVYKVFSGGSENAAETLRTRMPFGHPGLLHRAGVLRRYPFDSGLKIVADYDFFCRAFAGGAAAQDLGFTVTLMASGGISERLSKRLEVFREHTAVRARYFGSTCNARTAAHFAKSLFGYTLGMVFGEERGSVLLHRIKRVVRGEDA